MLQSGGGGTNTENSFLEKTKSQLFSEPKKCLFARVSQDMFSFSGLLSFSAWDKAPQIGNSVLFAHDPFVQQAIIAYI